MLVLAYWQCASFINSPVLSKMQEECVKQSLTYMFNMSLISSRLSAWLSLNLSTVGSVVNMLQKGVESCDRYNIRPKLGLICPSTTYNFHHHIIYTSHLGTDLWGSEYLLSDLLKTSEEVTLMQVNYCRENSISGEQKSAVYRWCIRGTVTIIYSAKRPSPRSLTVISSCLGFSIRNTTLKCRHKCLCFRANFISTTRLYHRSKRISCVPTDPYGSHDWSVLCGNSHMFMDTSLR